MAKKIDDELLEDVQACIVDEKNPDECINERLEAHGLGKEDKIRVLTKLLKNELG